jgi:hypothetical protein
MTYGNIVVASKNQGLHSDSEVEILEISTIYIEMYTIR